MMTAATPNETPNEQPSEKPNVTPAHRRHGRGWALGIAACMLAVGATLLVLAKNGAPTTLISPFATHTASSAPATPTTSKRLPVPIPKHFVLARLNLPALPALPTPPPSVASPSPCATPAAGSCVPCGTATGNNVSQAQIIAALNAAAAQYQLPVNLLYAVAWQESSWHEDVTSCDGGLGLMQVQDYTYPWLNALDEPSCGIVPTQYTNPSTSVEDNAFLGAKYLKWLECLYAYNGPGGGTSTVPAPGGSAYAYQQSGLAYPDTQTSKGLPTTSTCTPASGISPTPGASATATASAPASSTPSPTASPIAGLTPSATPAPCSLCLTLFENNSNGPAATTYQDLPSTSSDPWSCPIDPTKGDSDYELLDLVLSAYNAGPGSISGCGCIPNLDYVGTVEYWISEFRLGVLPLTH
jgi:hypothetical protein